jgi:hypothetical protein
MTGSEILLSLGYEPYDVRLWRLVRSPTAALTLADGVRRLPYLTSSQHLVRKSVHKPGI